MMAGKRNCRALGFGLFNKKFLLLLTMAALGLILPRSAHATKGDCGQPLSTGTDPVATDARRILTTGVGATVCSLPLDGFDACICDVNGDGNINASDALIDLKEAVGQNVTLNCSCGGTTLPPTTTSSTTTTTLGGSGRGMCGAAVITTLDSSVLSVGWTGNGHNMHPSRGVWTTLDVVRRCTDSGGGQSVVCLTDSDCGAGDSCEPTCDCDDPASNVCELDGPNGPRRCSTDGAGCTTNADCAVPGDECVHFQGAPQPRFLAGSPFCLVSRFDGGVSETLDPVSGVSSVQTHLLTRVYVLSGGVPCPTCDTGSLRGDKLGASGICSGGTDNAGKACIVDATNPAGNTSLDCIPSASDNISGSGLPVNLGSLTTETVSRSALQVCSSIPFLGFCADTVGGTPEVCASNTDCLRCTGDLNRCAGNSDCSGGTCAAAPVQPVACGFYCHVSFCQISGVRDPAKPCFDDSDCSVGESCGTGSDGFSGPNMAQERPNGCANAICGTAGAEICEGDTVGSCDGNADRPCSEDLDCKNQQAGSTCVFSPKPCFENLIAATGSRSALGRHCVENTPVTVCKTGADCGGTPCVADTAAPTYAAVFAMSASPTSDIINSVVGLPGPGRVLLAQVVRFCRCGDGLVGCGERCDDGNNNDGDGCSRECLLEP